MISSNLRVSKYDHLVTQRTDCLSAHLPSIYHPYFIFQLKSLSVAGLKEICQGLGVPVGGVKKVLLERICDAVDKLI